jgi:hypothetical protein
VTSALIFFVDLLHLFFIFALVIAPRLCSFLSPTTWKRLDWHAASMINLIATHHSLRDDRPPLRGRLRSQLLAIALVHALARVVRHLVRHRRA